MNRPDRIRKRESKPRLVSALVAGSLVMTWLGVTRATVAGEASGADIRVAFGKIADRRGTEAFQSECEVEIRVFGDLVAECYGLRDIRVEFAEDDTGRNLKRDKERSSFSRSFSPNTNSNVTLSKAVKLKNPARRAQTIRSLQGQVEFFVPTVENGGKIVVKNFQARPGEPIESPKLKELGVLAMFLTKESYETKKAEYEAKETENKDAAAGLGEAFGEAFGELFKGMFGGMMGSGKNSLYFFIDDPDQRVVHLVIKDAEGQAIRTRGHSSSGKWRTYSMGDKPAPKDAQLLIYLATPDAVKTVPFELKDIPLP